MTLKEGINKVIQFISNTNTETNVMQAEPEKRKLASIQSISYINPIPNADKIEIAGVLGWQCVVKKGEFKVGDQCVYFEIDSMVPIREWSKFLERKDKPEKPVRIRTMRFLGQLSQGLALPVSILNGEFKVGDDVTEILGVEKYEAPIPACLAGQVRGSFPIEVPKTDEMRLQSYPDLMDEFHNKLCAVTIKCDGTSATFVNIRGDHHVCSRNWSLKDDGKNTYWKMYHEYNLKQVLDDLGDVAIQGEIVGPGIQKNRMGYKEHRLLVFDIYDIQAGRRLCHGDLEKVCRQYNLETVPVFGEINFVFNSVDELINYAEVMLYPSNGELAEGIVIRPVVEFYSQVLKGRASFKVISNKYLEKHGE